MTDALFSEAQQYFPGGVSSPAWAFKATGGTPRFFKSAKGAISIDEDDQEYIDYLGSYGPLILGQCHPAVVQALEAQIHRGITYATPTRLQIELAEKIQEFMPNLEMMRFVCSGTEAGMSVIRLARAYTNRPKILKFEGCYHGHTDSLLVEAGSGALNLGHPSSPGVPDELTQHTLVAEYNNLDQVQALFEQWGSEIAAILVEPIAGNMNCVLPQDGFLQGLRDLCDQHQSLLIFDEVMTGFRVAAGGAQSIYQIKPDLSLLGKVVGGGLPLAVYGGKREIMAMISPSGPVYQAGTLSGNPLATAAGLATLKELAKPGFYDRLTQKSQQLISGMQEIADQANIPFQAHALGGMIGFFFSDHKPIRNLTDVKACDESRFNQFFHGMLSRGVYFAPSRFEATFMSAAHEQSHIDATLRAFNEVIHELSR